jgi:hypothetical protein
MCIRSYKAIFADFGITETDYYEIEKNAFFKRAKEQFTIEWNSALSTADRVRLQAAAATEVILPVLGRRMLVGTEPLASVIDGAKFFAKTAGIGSGEGEQKTGERFVITINIGDKSKTYDKALDLTAGGDKALAHVD